MNELNRGRIVALRRGVYMSADVTFGTDPKSQRHRLAVHSAAAVLSQPGSTASHRSAAALADSWILNPPDRACVTVTPGLRSSAAGLHVHRATLDLPDDIVGDALIPRTSSARTVIDVARESGVDEAVVVADCALKRGRTDLARLNRALVGKHTWPGIALAAEAIGRCDGKSESALETVSRLRIEESGLPIPRLQVNIYDRRGISVARPDFYWDDFGVIGEADGMEKYENGPPGALTREKFRQEKLERTGLLSVRWGWRDLDELDRLFERIRWTFGRGLRPSDPARLWRVHR
ncbi:MAG: hypothetical protein JWM76_1463 [Pseudonocardiales bacterium]|nr:hypothetical protein [Pseudonocardiales bacterium]